MQKQVVFSGECSGKRSLAFGGNSRREYFPNVASCIDFVNDVTGFRTLNIIYKINT